MDADGRATHDSGRFADRLPPHHHAIHCVKGVV